MIIWHVIKKCPNLLTYIYHNRQLFCTSDCRKKQGAKGVGVVVKTRRALARGRKRAPAFQAQRIV